jgi:hypothetical protein
MILKTLSYVGGVILDGFPEHFQSGQSSGIEFRKVGVGVEAGAGPWMVALPRNLGVRGATRLSLNPKLSITETR